MTQLATEELIVLAKSVGLSQANAVIAAAVALAESGGNTAARNPKTGTQPTGCVAYGLWQILNCPGWHVDYRSAVAAAPEDPHLNAVAMARISNGGKNWGPWVAFTSGAYKKKLPAAQVAGQNVAGGLYHGDPNAPDAKPDTSDGAYGGALNKPNDPTNTDAGDASSPIGSTIGDILDVLKVLTASATWYRVGLFVLGLVAALFGLVIVERDTLEQAAALVA